MAEKTRRHENDMFLNVLDNHKNIVFEVSAKTG